MPLDRRKTESALTVKLQMELRKGRRDDHRYYRFLHDGKIIAQTKVSTGSGHRDIGDPIVREMARQMQIPTSLLNEIVGCTKGLTEYLLALKSQNLIS